jgi:hypothetical protein
VRVTFVRGPRRVVVGADSSPLGGVYGLVHAVRVEVSVLEPLDVPDEDEVVDDGPLMSVVTGGLVLVIVAVVVGVDDEPVAVAENDGSTKFRGARSGSLDWRDTNVTAAMRMPITARPTTLAPITAGVRLYHGADDGDCSSSWSSGSWPAMASDSSRGPRPDAGSAELRHDLGGEELEVVEVGHVEELQVHPLHTHLYVGSQLVRDLGRRSHRRGAAA